MPRTARALFALSLVAIAGACGSESRLPTGVSAMVSPLAARGGGTDITATWLFPLTDAALSLRSDRKYADASGTYSAYANGVCSVSSTIFYGGTGDNTMSFSNPTAKRCGRTWTLAFPDGYSETLAYGAGVQVLESPTFDIPVGTTAKRHMRIGTGARCSQGLVFGPGGANPAAGSDSVLVTRIDASTWSVASQPAPNDNAYCIDNGQLYEMQVAFRIVSSQPLR